MSNTTQQIPTRFLVEAAMQIAAEMNLRCDVLSDEWVIRLESQSGSHKSIIGYRFDLNTAAAADIAQDKSATAHYLAHANIPHVPHFFMMQPTLDMNAIRQCVEEFGGFPIVCKPNTGTGGNDIVRAHSHTELGSALHTLFTRHSGVALAPFKAIVTEYRVIILDSTALLVFGKVAAPNEWQHNLSRGARIIESTEIDTHRIAQLQQLALDTTSTIGLRFASVDIIHTDDDELLVLEVNSGVMMEKFAAHSVSTRETALDIYRKAITAMFS